MMKKTLLAILLLAAAPLLRADEGTLSVAPAVVMLRGEAGQSTTQTMFLTNGTSQPFSFELQARDVLVRDGKRFFADAGSTPGSIAATAVFSQKSVTVPPGEKVRVDVTVTIPPHPSARAVVALFHGTTKVRSGNTSITASLGMLLTFTLSDALTANASPLQVEAPTATRNLSVAQEVTNSGSEPMVARGVLAIVNGAGTLMGKETLPSRRLLPGERTDMRAEYAGDLPPGRYRALVTYDLQKETLTSTAEFEVR
jgi:hypothetical protein